MAQVSTDRENMSFKHVIAQVIHVLCAVTALIQYCTECHPVYWLRLADSLLSTLQ